MQEVVTLSSTEADYVTLSTGGKEAFWLLRLVANLKKIVLELWKEPIVIYVDNQGSMYLVMNGSSNRHRKHINVRYHFFQQSIDEEKIKLDYCPTELTVKSKQICDLNSGLELESD